MRVKAKENESFEKTLRRFKKKVDESNRLKDLREKESYTKPSMRKKLMKNAAKKRWLKFLKSNELPERKY